MVYIVKLYLDTLEINDADPEVKSSVKVNTTAADSSNIVVDALERISLWKKMRHVIAIMLKWK